MIYDTEWPGGWEREPHRCSSDGACRHGGAWGPWLPYRTLAAVSGGLSPNDIATVTGMSRRTIYRWVLRDAIPVRFTDRCAVALGLHPINVWLDWPFVVRQPGARIGKMSAVSGARDCLRSPSPLPDTYREVSRHAD